MQTASVVTSQLRAVPLVRMLTPEECGLGIPYGVAGLCAKWQTENFKGSRGRPQPAYRAQWGLRILGQNWRV